MFNISKMAPFACDLVIAHYKEPIEWMKKFESFPFRTIFIYTKGDGSKPPVLPYSHPNVKIITMKNIGRCDHTYLHHMHEHYDSHADVTIFTTASAGNLAHKDATIKFIIPKVFEQKNSVFRVTHETEFKKKFTGFKVDTWRSSNINNQEANSTKDSVYPATIRPFEKWYESLFSGINTHHVVYGGLFAVSKDHIHHRKKDFYKKLLDQFPDHSNPEVGHYFERVWLTIFYPVPENCIYLDITSNPAAEIKYVGGSARKSRRARKRRAPKSSKYYRSRSRSTLGRSKGGRR